MAERQRGDGEERRCKRRLATISYMHNYLHFPLGVRRLHPSGMRYHCAYKTPMLLTLAGFEPRARGCPGHKSDTGRVVVRIWYHEVEDLSSQL